MVGSNKNRSRGFYRFLAVSFPVFFLLHWNGLFDLTYYWALELVDGTRSGLAQFVFAFISSVVIYAGIFLIHWLFVWVAHRDG